MATRTIAPAKSDIYVGMLVVSLLMLIVSCVLLFLDKNQYPGKAPAVPAMPQSKPPAATAPGS